MGDYDQMDADNGFFYTTWGDNRDRNLANTRYQANVRFAAFPIYLFSVSLIHQLSQALLNYFRNHWIICDWLKTCGSCPISISTTSSNWHLTDEGLVQDSDINDGDTTRNGLPKLGTYAIPSTDGYGWANYEFTTKLKSTNGNAFGVIFRYQNDSTYYRFSMDSLRFYRRLTKVVNNNWSLLAEDSVQYTSGVWYNLKVRALGSNLKVYLNDTAILTANDSSLSYGNVGLYTWDAQTAYFGDVAVTAISTAAPVANFYANPTSGVSMSTALLNVDFVDLSGVNLPENDITNWYWDFGDGGTSTTQYTSHSYTPVSVKTFYTVQLIVSNDYGISTITKTNYITVYPPPAIIVIVDSNPLGRRVKVNGRDYTAPYTFSIPTGYCFNIGLDSLQIVENEPPWLGNTKYSYVSWSDGGSSTHIVCPSSNTTFTATFDTQYYLTVQANPSNGGVVSPSSNFFSSGAVICCTAIPTSGWIFTGWSGDLSGFTNPQCITMDSSKLVIANFSSSTWAPLWIESSLLLDYPNVENGNNAVGIKERKIQNIQ